MPEAFDGDLAEDGAAPEEAGGVRERGIVTLAVDFLITNPCHC